MGQLKVLKLTQIRPNVSAIRQVDLESAEFKSLCDSIKKDGVMQTISVRLKADPNGGEFYELVDGLHRFTAAKQVGNGSGQDSDTIGVNVLDADDMQVAVAQLTSNMQRIATKPAEYAEHLERMMNLDPTLTAPRIAQLLCVSPAWVNDRLSLNKIVDPDTRTLIDNGEIKLASALALARLAALKPEEVAAYVPAAVSETPETFITTVTARIKEIREARRKGQAENPPEFAPVARPRKTKELNAEKDSHEARAALITAMGLKTAAEGFDAGILWCLSSDPISVEAQRVAFETAKKVREEKQEARKIELLKKKADKAKKDGEAAQKAAAEAQAALAGR